MIPPVMRVVRAAGGGCSAPENPEQEGRGDRGSNVRLHALQILINLIVQIANEGYPQDANGDNGSGREASDEYQAPL